MIFLILVFLLEGLRETETLSVEGVLGKDITIECTHTNAFSNIKYFCKEACKEEDILIRSRKNEKGSNDRYSIIDEGNTFKVTISRLTQKDSGTYWCGIERTGVDTYNVVYLTVIMENPDEATYASSSKKLVYVGAGLAVVVLTLAIVLLIFFRHRNRDITSSSGMDHVYTSVSSQKQGAHQITTSSSTANEDQETDGTTDNIFRSLSVQHQDISSDHADNIYSNVTVSSEPQVQPDSLSYSTVSFYKQTDCRSVTPRTASATYASIKYISTDESTVYCDV